MIYFDGVFTDNHVLVQEDGSETVICDREDGMSIGMFQEKGIRIVMLSTEVDSIANAHPTVLKSADIVLSKTGGYGAVCELAEIISNY